MPRHALAFFLNPPLRIYLSPSLRENAASSIRWTWRTLLVWLGVAWTEVVSDAAACDVAYVADGDESPPARLTIRTDPAAWAAALHPSDAPVTRLRRFSDPAAWDRVVDRSSGATVCGYDPFPDAFALLAGIVERSWPRNRHGQVQPAGASLDNENTRLTPIVSAVVDRVEVLLRQCGAVNEITPRWPHGRAWAASATHDVDYPQVVRWLEPVRMLARRGWHGVDAAWAIAAGTRHQWHFDSWMSLERSLEMRSAFYFGARRGSLLQYALGTPDSFYDVRQPEFTRVLRRLDVEGFEVGLHASYRACESAQTLARENETLSAAVGHPVDGIRHHYWRLDPDDPDATFAAQASIGLLYDSSLGFERYPGWRRGSALPFAPYDHRTGAGVGTLELPNAWMDAQLFLYGSGRFRTEEQRHALLARLIDAAAASRGLLVADMHDYVFDEVLYPGWREAWQWLWEQVAARSDVWVALPREVARHWRQRTHAIVTASRGLQVTN